MPKIPIKGTVKLDVRDSVPDWTPHTPPKAPEGAPNILFVLYDDTGLAAWPPFGGSINMPTLQKLADNGLRYSQWHTINFPATAERPRWRFFSPSPRPML
jgi:arylsulfatase